ncbi:MAG: hypothetical protein QNJ31_04230 [Candidatus Caenarcaniphilales bacterium]|nr:hypothetical protein [Candidatus Caenarcaniphilales bacterium]
MQDYILLLNIAFSIHRSLSWLLSTIFAVYVILFPWQGDNSLRNFCKEYSIEKPAKIITVYSAKLRIGLDTNDKVLFIRDIYSFFPFNPAGSFSPKPRHSVDTYWIKQESFSQSVFCRFSQNCRKKIHIATNKNGNYKIFYSKTQAEEFAGLKNENIDFEALRNRAKYVGTRTFLMIPCLYTSKDHRYEVKLTYEGTKGYFVQLKSKKLYEKLKLSKNKKVAAKFKAFYFYQGIPYLIRLETVDDIKINPEKELVSAGGPSCSGNTECAVACSDLDEDFRQNPWADGLSDSEAEELQYNLLSDTSP